MKTVKASEIGTGDSIEVGILGEGKTFRPVDKVDHDGDNVTITLYSEWGRRPKFTVNKNYLIVRE